MAKKGKSVRFAAGALAARGELSNLGRVLQQDTRAGATPAAYTSPDVPQCPTPWEIFNSTTELSFWAEALQTVGFAGAPSLRCTLHEQALQAPCKAFFAQLHMLCSTEVMNTLLRKQP